MILGVDIKKWSSQHEVRWRLICFECFSTRAAYRILKYQYSANRSGLMIINLNVNMSQDKHECPHTQARSHRCTHAQTNTRCSADTCTKRKSCLSVHLVEALKFRSGKQPIHSSIDSIIPSASHSLPHWSICSFNQPFSNVIWAGST